MTSEQIKKPSFEPDKTKQAAETKEQQRFEAIKKEVNGLFETISYKPEYDEWDMLDEIIKEKVVAKAGYGKQKDEQKDLSLAQKIAAKFFAARYGKDIAPYFTDKEISLEEIGSLCTPLQKKEQEEQRQIYLDVKNWLEGDYGYKLGMGDAAVLRAIIKQVRREAQAVENEIAEARGQGDKAKVKLLEDNRPASYLAEILARFALNPRIGVRDVASFPLKHPIGHPEETKVLGRYMTERRDQDQEEADKREKRKTCMEPLPENLQRLNPKKLKNKRKNG